MGLKVNRPILKTIFIVISRDERLNHKKKAFLSEYKTINSLNYAGSSDPKQVLSIYFPKKEVDKGITIIDVHGGAYVTGGIGTNMPYLKYLVEHGYTVINIDYRLIKVRNDTTIKDQIMDTCLAMNYIYDHYKEWGVPSSFSLLGDSSGSHLTLLYSEILHSNEKLNYLVDDLELKPMEIKSMVMSSPCTDYKLLYDDGMRLITKRAVYLVFPPKKISKEDVIKYSAFQRLEEGYPLPIIFTSSKKDFINDQSVELNSKLNELNIPHEYIYADENSFKIGHIYNQNIKDGNPIREEANQKIMEFIDAHK
ncbi:MAG: alpha/beta hydrolase [Coprobacillus sp.]|nr:alpha/beta hydrolase [Coprobacillus sp.]